MMNCRAQPQPYRPNALTRAYPFADPYAFIRSTTSTRRLNSVLLLGPSQNEIVLDLPELAGETELVSAYRILNVLELGKQALLHPKTASDWMYGSSGSKMCVVSVSKPWALMM